MERTIVGIDTGGTFTDFVYMDGADLRIHKEPSTPDDPARAVLAGLQQLLGERVADIVHGSTVATNALLERKGAVTALVTTAGFEDVIEIGRQARRSIYDLAVEKSPPLVPTELRLGLAERMGPRGEVIEPLADEEVRRVVDEIDRLDVESVAICTLHAYANAEHERSVAARLKGRELFCAASHEILPEFREYERCSTTVVNAYVGPVMQGYLARIGEQIDAERVRIMQSNGGIISLRAAQRHAVRTILSGPAGGVVGGFEIGRRGGFENVITLDMGGTSTDVCLCPGKITHTAESVIGEAPIRVPVIDIHTVGAGGGSIAFRDPGGALRVGPRSAGAVPGPIAYGRGGAELTVTDANLFLGRLSPNHFLGGAQRLVTRPVQGALSDFGRELGLSPVEAAEGIVRVANATMERAIRVISMERGFDPRDFTLVCFGGAGAMHAAALAGRLSIPRVLVPSTAGIHSAMGLLLADQVRDYSQTLLVACDDLRSGFLESAFDAFEHRARKDFSEEGFDPDLLATERSVDMRYVGQGYELGVQMSDDVEQSFHRAHERRYGYADAERPTEIVNVRVKAIAETDKPPLPEDEPGGEDAHTAFLGETAMVFGGEECRGDLVDRSRLQPGNVVQGPALVVEYSTTTVVPPGHRCKVDRWYSLVLEREGPTS